VGGYIILLTAVRDRDRATTTTTTTTTTSRIGRKGIEKICGLCDKGSKKMKVKVKRSRVQLGL
jgi:hypothetical protein